MTHMSQARLSGDRLTGVERRLFHVRTSRFFLESGESRREQSSVLGILITSLVCEKESKVHTSGRTFVMQPYGPLGRCLQDPCSIGYG